MPDGYLSQDEGEKDSDDERAMASMTDENGETPVKGKRPETAEKVPS